MKHKITRLVFLTAFIFLAGCGFPGAEQMPATTPVIPTPTMEPMAALVNGEGITIAEYQAELDRYLAAANETGRSAPGGVEPKTMILDQLIDDLLLAQSAYLAGFQLNDAELENRITQLSEQMGGAQALQEWVMDNGYTDAGLRQAMHRSIAAAWMRDQIVASVPLKSEQIHARQILLFDEQAAVAIKSQLDGGVDFTILAYQYDPVNGGDLGWFPRGTLNIPEVESAAFSQEIGTYSDIIKSAIGWHIILVIEKDPAHELSSDALLALQHQAISRWLAERHSESTISILI